MCAGAMGFGSDEERKCSEMTKNVISDIKKSFRPELFNRIDDVIVFSKLNEADVYEICDIMLKKLSERLSKLGIVLDVTDGAKKIIIKRGFDEKYGARSLRRELQSSVEDALTDEYLKSNCAGGHYRVYHENEKIKVERAV